MFSGLRGEGINKRYLETLKNRILVPIAIELRHDLGLPDVKSVPLKTAEEKNLKNLIFYGKLPLFKALR